MTGFVSWLRAEWDRAVGVGFLAAGAVSLMVGYAGVADASYVPQALSFIASGGFFGLLLVAVGATLLITAALHDEWRKLDRIEKAIDRLGDRLAGGADPLDLDVRGAPGAPRPTEHAALAEAIRCSGDQGVAVVAGPDSRPALLAIAGLVVAAGLVGGGWSATAAAVDDDTAYAMLLFGIVGIAVAGLASTGWTLSLRRAARVRQARLLEPFAPFLTGSGPAAPMAEVAVADGLAATTSRAAPLSARCPCSWSTGRSRSVPG